MDKDIDFSLLQTEGLLWPFSQLWAPPSPLLMVMHPSSFWQSMTYLNPGSFSPIYNTREAQVHQKHLISVAHLTVTFSICPMTGAGPPGGWHFNANRHITMRNSPSYTFTHFLYNPFLSYWALRIQSSPCLIAYPPITNYLLSMSIYSQAYQSLAMWHGHLFLAWKKTLKIRGVIGKVHCKSE